MNIFLLLDLNFFFQHLRTVIDKFYNISIETVHRFYMKGPWKRPLNTFTCAGFFSIYLNLKCNCSACILQYFSEVSGSTGLRALADREIRIPRGPRSLRSTRIHVIMKQSIHCIHITKAEVLIPTVWFFSNADPDAGFLQNLAKFEFEKIKTLQIFRNQGQQFYQSILQTYSFLSQSRLRKLLQTFFLCSKCLIRIHSVRVKTIL